MGWSRGAVASFNALALPPPTLLPRRSISVAGRTGAAVSRSVGIEGVPPRLWGGPLEPDFAHESGRLVETATGWSIKKFVRTALRYRSV